MLKRHISTTTISTAAILVMTVFRQMIIYKNLSVQSVGVYAFIGTIVVFLQPIISGDIRLFVMSRCPEFPIPKALGLVKTAIVFEVLMGCVACALFYGLVTVGLPISRIFKVIEDPRVLYWCFPIVTLSSVLAHAQRYLSSKLLITTSNIVEFVSSLSYLALLSVFFFYVKVISIYSVFLCWLLSIVIPFLGLVAYLWKDLLHSERVDWRYIPPALRFSLPSLVADYGNNVVGYFDRLAIGHYMTATSLGLYGFIYNLMNMAQVAARSVMDSLFTSYFLYAVKNKQRGLAQTALDVYLRWGSLAAFVVLIFFASYGQRFILLMSKPDMIPSYPYFFILWPLFVINMVTQIKSIHMNYVEEKRSKLVWCHLIIIPVTIVTYMISIKHFHLVGACIASTLTASFTYLVMSWYTRMFRVMPYLFHFKWAALATLFLAAVINKLISFEVLKLGNNAIVVVLGGVIVTATSVLVGILVRLVSWNDKNRLSLELTAASISIREEKLA